MSDREKDYAPLSMACVRGLCDKLFEKRKIAGQEIEKMVKEFVEANNTSQIQRLVKVLSEDLMSSTNPNVKIGALLGLSSVGVGLGKACGDWLEALLPPLLANCGEGTRVRYHALEALFNVAKVSRCAVVPHAPALLDALVRLASDPDPQVAHAADLLDRLLKEVVCGSAGAGGAEWGVWAGALRAALGARGGTALALGWLGALTAAHAPPAALAPALLDPLLSALTHPDPELRRMCEVQLAALLRGVAAEGSRALLTALLPVLTAHAAAAAHTRTQLTALQWLAALVPSELEGEGGAGAAALASLPGLLAAALPPLAYTDDARRESREAAAALDARLQALVASAPHDVLDRLVEWVGCVQTLEGLLGGAGGAGCGGAVRGAALRWVRALYGRVAARMCTHTCRLHAHVLRAVRGDEARAAVRLLVDMARAHAASSADLHSSEYYTAALDGVLKLLAAEPALLEERGAFIIREVVVAGGAGTFEALGARAAGALAGPLAPLLAELLLCAPELRATRDDLRAFRTQEAAALFVALWRGWAASPVSLCALCLLTRRYRLAATLLTHVGSLEVSLELLSEVDRLVQLLESPIFAFLRLELAGAGPAGWEGPGGGEGPRGGESPGGAEGPREVEGPGGAEGPQGVEGPAGAESGAHLRAALSALLALLPQGDAFHTLRRRLKAHPPAHRCVCARVEGVTAIGRRRSLDEAGLMQEFVRYHKLADHP